MAAPIFMNMEQVPEGPYQQMFAPQMVPCCFVATPEFCEGMYVPPLGGYEAAWPQGVNRFPSQKRQGHQKRNYGAPRLPRNFPPNDVCNGPMWSQQDSGSQEPVTVELSCLPKMLCNKACLEASIEQAGLEKDVQSLELKASDAGEATLILANERAARRCVQHFDGLQWAKSAQPVSARYFVQQPQQQEEVPESFEKEAPKDLAPTPLTMTPKSTPKLSPKSSFSGSPSMKPRWADLDSDDDDEDLVSKSTQSGTWNSAPASSDSGEASNSEHEL